MAAIWSRRAPGALKAGVTINGLPIVNDRPNPWGYPPPKNLDRYYFERGDRRARARLSSSRAGSGVSATP